MVSSCASALDLITHVDGEQVQSEVVRYDDTLQVVRASVAHEPGSEPYRGEVEYEDGADELRVADQKPVLRARVCNDVTLYVIHVNISQVHTTLPPLAWIEA